jgi:hypothetical protein
MVATWTLTEGGALAKDAPNLPRGLPRPLFLVRSASILKTAEISMAAFFRAVFF